MLPFKDEKKNGKTQNLFKFKGFKDKNKKS